MQLISDIAVIFFPEVNFIHRAIYYLLHIGIMLQLYFENQYYFKINNISFIIFLNLLFFVIQDKEK